MISTFKLCLLLSLTGRAGGHGIMRTPTPRTGAQVAGDNKGGAGTGACGENDQATKGAVSATYEAGQEVTIVWEATIPHGGNCVISIDTTEGTPGQNDDGNYDVDGNGILTQHTLKPSFPCAADRGEEATTVTIPADISCENCILQWFWDGDQNYYDCADIKINAAGGGGGGNALFSPDLYSPSNLNTTGLVMSGFTGIILIGLVFYRLKKFREQEDLVYDTYEAGWPTRGAYMERAGGLLLMAAEAGLIFAVPSFSNVMSLIQSFALSLVGMIYYAVLLKKTKDGAEGLQEKSTWIKLLFLDVILLLLFAYSTFYSSIREYATWIIENDSDEDPEMQKNTYYLSILVGWMILAIMFWQLVHTLALVGWCVPGDGLLAYEKQKKKKKKKKSSKGSKKSKKGSKGSKKSKKKGKKGSKGSAVAIAIDSD